jgi:hypothetical protein
MKEEPEEPEGYGPQQNTFRRIRSGKGRKIGADAR